MKATFKSFISMVNSVNISQRQATESKLNLPRQPLLIYWLILLVLIALSSSCSTKKAPPPSAPAQIQINNQNGEAGNKVLSVSKSLLGSNYRYGGSTPAKGFDCSGLVLYSYQQALGVKLPRTAQNQSKAASYKGKDVDDLLIGDLVVFNNYQHVGIYIGNGEFIHAPTSKGKVRIEKLSLPYWSNNYTGGFSYFVNN